VSVTRDKNGRLLPGSKSLNPGGRPRTPEHVKAMLEGLTEKAVFALEDALDGDDPKLRVVAAQEVLNRALGRPHTSASVDVKAVDNSRALLEALIAVNAEEKQPMVIDAVATTDAGLHAGVPLAIESRSDAD
jgi:hypothetical protein